MWNDAPNNADNFPRCSSDEVPHVHLPVAGTAPIGVKAVEGRRHTEEAFIQAQAAPIPCVHPLLATAVMEQGSHVSVQEI